MNDRQVTLDVHPGERLVDTLRDRLGLTGTKEGCGVGECGACTVVVDGDAVNSCLVLTVQCDGAAILTVEGLAPAGQLSRLQRAFLEHGAVQCGFCTPGMLMSATASWLEIPGPRGKRSARHWQETRVGNGYEQIVQAVEAVANEAE